MAQFEPHITTTTANRSSAARRERVCFIVDPTLRSAIVALDMESTIGSTGLYKRAIYWILIEPVMSNLLAGAVDFDLHPAGDETLTHQLYEQLRGSILGGSLPPGHRLPSSREFARQLKVSRNTVSFVIDQLAMEGYLIVTQGRRPVIAAVSKPRLVPRLVSRLASGRQTSRRAAATARISRWAQRVRKADWPFANEGQPRTFVP